MKKVLLFGIFLFFQYGFAQTMLDKKNAVIKGVKIESLQDPKLDFINNAKISWDFSSLDLTNKTVSIEVVTIYDCFNGENASDFKETISVLNKENFTKQGSRDLIHVELMAKCLKWRLVLVENNQTKVSDWSYFSFLK
ncbi:hypothetical protein [Flavobacterium sasangense]|uniref:hypothetical protein n=1 Tax=Flavobacterium sasangense TaxID=503361 RepID=UPI00047A9EC3|nr:hypothetical protein [Flavobacterium sasangense]